MMPLMPSPGRPKTTSTPQSIKDSTNTSDAVMARFSSVFAKWDCGRRAGDATHREIGQLGDSKLHHKGHEGNTKVANLTALMTPGLSRQTRNVWEWLLLR